MTPRTTSLYDIGYYTLCPKECNIYIDVTVILRLGSIRAALSQIKTKKG